MLRPRPSPPNEPRIAHCTTNRELQIAKFEVRITHQAETLSASAVFALPQAGTGAILSLGTEALLSLCQMATPRGVVDSVCTGTPAQLKPIAAAPSGTVRHRLLQLQPVSATRFSIQPV